LLVGVSKAALPSMAVGATNPPVSVEFRAFCCIRVTDAPSSAGVVYTGALDYFLEPRGECSPRPEADAGGARWSSR